jgi:anti-sigma factor RsiW
VTIRLAHISCRELVELVTAYLEGTLSQEDRLRFENHIAECDHCTTYLEQTRRTIELTGKLRIDDVSPVAEQALLHAFRDWRGQDNC